MRAKYDVLDRHCADVGRDPAEITRTVLASITLVTHGGTTTGAGSRTMSVAQAVDKVGALGAVGTDTVILSMADAAEPAAYDLVAELAEEVAAL